MENIVQIQSNISRLSKLVVLIGLIISTILLITPLSIPTKKRQSCFDEVSDSAAQLMRCGGTLLIGVVVIIMLQTLTVQLYRQIVTESANVGGGNSHAEGLQLVQLTENVKQLEEKIKNLKQSPIVSQIEYSSNETDTEQ